MQQRCRSAFAAPASAHAELEETTPANGQRLDVSPETVTLTFTESVTSPSGGIGVLSSGGERVDNGTVDVDGNVVTAGLEPDLADDTYIVAWRAISADSHPVHGAFTFIVGDGPAVDDATLAGLLDDGSDRPWQIAGAVARGFAYLGALLAAGIALFMALVEDVEGRTIRGYLLGAACIGAAGLFLTLPIQAQQATGLGAGALFESGVASDVLGDGVGVVGRHHHRRARLHHRGLTRQRTMASTTAPCRRRGGRRRVRGVRAHDRDRSRVAGHHQRRRPRRGRRGVVRRTRAARGRAPPPP